MRQDPLFYFKFSQISRIFAKKWERNRNSKNPPKTVSRIFLLLSLRSPSPLPTIQHFSQNKSIKNLELFSCSLYRYALRRNCRHRPSPPAPSSGTSNNPLKKYPKNFYVVISKFMTKRFPVYKRANIFFLLNLVCLCWVKRKKKKSEMPRRPFVSIATPPPSPLRRFLLHFFVPQLSRVSSLWKVRGENCGRPEESPQSTWQSWLLTRFNLTIF